MTSRTQNRSMAHDVIAGILGGGGTGAVVGVLLAVRVLDADSRWGLFGGAAIGALIGILMLTSSHRESNRFLTPTLVVMWVLAVASGAFLYLLYDAIRNFS
ncbi:MAG: hypothetical protein L0Z49_06870 [Actinobacteria bacterium]|nr:hypothetical protein [Actinomycetota bacterium]MCI0544154.1 hypothetical protein [Actinomycetota bacterium]